MNISVIRLFALFAASAATTAFAVPGENWTIATTSEVAGMPGGMPAMSINVCLQKGGEKDPKMLTQQNDECVLSDVKSTKSKTTWKMVCNKDGNEMTGVGEVSYKSSSFEGKTRITGASDGKPVDMTAIFKGKKIGTPCDTSTPPTVLNGMENMNEMMGMVKSQMASAMDEQCEVSNFRATELISPRFFGEKAACAGKEKYACKVISKEIVKNPKTYIKLAKHDDTSDVSIANICKINMEEVTKKVCATVDGNNYRDLIDYCPNEANAFEPERSKPEKSGSATTGGLIDNASKLKGLFGF